MTQKIHVLNVRLPDDTIKWIDALVKQGVYNSRSEAIRDFMREHLREAGNSTGNTVGKEESR